MRQIVIIGAGGHGREVLDIFEALNGAGAQYDLLGYVVEPAYGAPGTVVNERPILGDFDWFAGRAKDVEAICAVGAPELRRRLVQRAREAGVRFCSIVHPSVVRTRWMTIGEGVVIAAGCVLTNQIRIGDHVHLNAGCSIAHDSVLENFAILAPGVHAAGGVIFEEGCNVGVGVSILPGRRIGRWSVVGGGSAVTADVPPNSTVVGVPGTVVKTRPPDWHLK